LLSVRTKMEVLSRDWEAEGTIPVPTAPATFAFASVPRSRRPLRKRRAEQDRRRLSPLVFADQACRGRVVKMTSDNSFTFPRRGMGRADETSGIRDLVFVHERFAACTWAPAAVLFSDRVFQSFRLLLLVFRKDLGGLLRAFLHRTMPGQNVNGGSNGRSSTRMEDQLRPGNL
jgi:hypothetical protein